MPEKFSDEDALSLLHLLHRYVRAFSPDIPQTISALAEDLATGFGGLAETWLKEILETEGVS